MKKLMKAAFINGLVLICVSLIVLPSFGADEYKEDAFIIERLTRAEVDECYNGVGEPYIPGPSCSPGEIPKTNQSYLWGLTKSGDKMWIGTASNMLCLFGGAYFRFLNPVRGGLENDMLVCEYMEGKYLKDNVSTRIPRIYSDFRQPKIYTYDLTNKYLTDITEQITDPEALRLIDSTFGMRSAVSFGNLVFMAGPDVINKSINMFVFNTTTEELVDAKSLDQYSNIRKWLVFNNILYTAVENSKGNGGKILRWNGTETNPIEFTEVGDIDGAGTEIVYHNERIYVATWPQNTRGPLPGIWQSPEIPKNGFTKAHRNSWKKVWQTDAYEPDPLMAHLYGIGALHSYRGKLYWGTMHVPSRSVFRVVMHNGISPIEWSNAMDNSQRAISIFRTEDFDDPSQIELLYGDAQLPVYNRKFFGGVWEMKDNNMGGIKGKFGLSGFGDPYNRYTWTMAVYKDKLFVGTWDNSSLLYARGNGDENNSGREREFNSPGADLWYFYSETEAARPVTEDGFGNMANYGIRTSFSDESTGLYIGTANPANIALDEFDNPMGGWELIRISEE